MSYSRISFLQKYCQSNFDNWRKTYGDNIICARVGKKEKNNSMGSRYCIVFHVEEKLENPENPIPETLEIQIPNEGSIAIKTDVKEIGKFKFQSLTVGNKAKHLNMIDAGAIGMLIERNGFMYVCSCMHVLGDPLLRNNINSYFLDISSQHTVDTVFFDNSNQAYGYLEQGLFGDIDAAISRIDNPNFFNRNIPGFGVHNGGITLNAGNFWNRPITIIGATSGNITSYIQGIEITYPAQLFGIKATLTKLICCFSVTTNGDSGSLVVDNETHKIVGIVIGADNSFTYIIPTWKILNHFNAILA